MTDPKYALRAGQAGPLVTGTPTNVLTLQTGGGVAGEPPGGGGSTPDPIQQVRYLDPNSLAEPNGSIAAPFIDPADFFGEVAAPGGWALQLPAIDVGDFSIPDLAGVPTALLGMMQTASVIGSIPIAAQGDSEPFDPLALTLRDLSARHLVFGGGPLELYAESCTLDQVEASGTITGRQRFVNCHLGTTMNFPDASVDLQGCTLGRDDGGSATFVLFDGTLRDCKFLNQVTFQFFGGVSLFDCTFGTGLRLQCSSSQTLTCDPVTYARLLDAEPVYVDTAPTFAQKPVVMYAAQVDLLNGAVIPAASVAAFSLGQMDPPALPDGTAQVQFVGSPNTTAVCVGAVVNGSGEVVASVLNTSDTLTAELLNGQPFSVIYEPAELVTF
jgi:hypothetical protein